MSNINMEMIDQLEFKDGSTYIWLVSIIFFVNTGSLKTKSVHN